MDEDSPPVAKAPAQYEAPRIETVLTDEQLAREVKYAGEVTQFQ